MATFIEAGCLKNYDNFFVAVDDLARAKEYYQNVLGLPVKFDFSNRGMVAFQVGEQEPAIILKDRNVFADAKPAIWFEVGDVRVEYEKMVAKGVKFLSPPFAIGTGMAAEFEDPFGNRFGIADYIKK
jgi:predicted enzyme related to lactoylglutathione lyase